MKVRAIRNYIGEEEHPGLRDLTCSLTIGKEYEVLGVLITKSVWYYYMFTDASEPFYGCRFGIPYFPSSEKFEIIDDSIPDHWVTAFHQQLDDQIEVRIGPTFMARNEMFPWLLFDSDETAMRVWENYCKEYLDHPPDLEWINL